MNSVFVTGGTGFVGSHLVEWLMGAERAQVKALVRSSRRWLEGLDLEEVSGTLEDPGVLDQAMKGVDTVYHNAGLTRSRLWADFERANVQGTLRVLEAAARRTTPPRVIVTSSLAAVGRAAVRIADEGTPLDPVSLYGRSKAAMEAAMAPWMGRLPITIVRPPAVYGPRDADILTFFKSVAKGICPIVGNGKDPAVTLVYVGDLIRGMVAAGKREEAIGRTYFIGTPKPDSWNEVRDATAAALGRRVLTIPIPTSLVVPIGVISERVAALFGGYPALNREKATEIRDACTMCSSAQAATDLGYRARTSLEVGVRQTIEWYRDEEWL